MEVNCEKYNIDGSNYFKLHDIAYLFRDTTARFSVAWDDASQTVSIISGQAYTPDGSELVVDGTDKSSSAVESSQSILANGETVSDLSVYNHQNAEALIASKQAGWVIFAVNLFEMSH